MDMENLVPLLRMLERSLIVAGGILSIFLGYKLFVLGIDKSQGQASAFGVELKNFGPGLFFAALGAVVLVTTMRAAISIGHENAATSGAARATQVQGEPAVSGAPMFFGLEDPTRVADRWSAMHFFLETRQLLGRLEEGETADGLQDLRTSLERKLETITMTKQEYTRYQALTGKVPLSEDEQRELLLLESKLAPLE